ncbi:MAG: isochorismatase [Verrucomicrobiales bacterium]|nr:isochorismatase [Verrucomicrobiales bacterium]
MKLFEEYRPRPIQFLENWRIDAWIIKVYGITYTEDPLDQILIESAREAIIERLKESASETNHYGVGFAGIHQGKTGKFVFVDWWADENELHHHVYVSQSEKPSELKYMTPTGLTACAWDLYLICHERRAWVEFVLMQASDPDMEGYLHATVNEII